MRIATSSASSRFPVATSLAPPRPAPTTAEPTDSCTLSVPERIDELEATSQRLRNIGDGLGVFMFLGFPAWVAPCFVLGGATGLGVGATIGLSLLAGSAYAESKSRDYHDQASELRNQKPTA